MTDHRVQALQVDHRVVAGRDQPEPVLGVLQEQVLAVGPGDGGLDLFPLTDPEHGRVIGGGVVYPVGTRIPMTAFAQKVLAGLPDSNIASESRRLIADITPGAKMPRKSHVKRRRFIFDDSRNG